MNKNLVILLAAIISVVGCGGGSGGISTPSTPVVTTPAPMISLTLSKPKVSLGSSSIVTWSATNATTCTASGAWSGTQAISGTSAQTPTASGASTYTLTCTGAGGSSNQSVALIVPIPVQKTSNLNSKNLNIPSQKIPVLPSTSSSYADYITAGVAFGDFFQTGEISLVTFTNRDVLPKLTNFSSATGVVKFFKKMNGEWVEQTKVLDVDTGCISPRRVLVADFNNDGIPDVFASCHGSEAGSYMTWPGEAPRILLSQSDGTYKNIAAPITCYCHGSSAGDIDSDGNIDIVVSDFNRARDGKSSYVILKGDGTGSFSAIEESGFIAPTADFDYFDKNYYKPSFDVELIDFNNDGKLDIFLGTGEQANSYILTGNGKGQFPTVLKTFPKTTTDYHFNDAVFSGGFLYIYTNLNSDNYKSQIRKYDLNSEGYTVIYDGATAHPNWIGWDHENIFIMPYNGFMTAYNSKYNLSVKIN